MKRLQVAHKTACGLAPARLVGHAPQYLLFQSHPLTSGFSSLKLQAATGPLHVLCPVLASLLSYLPSHLDAPRNVTLCSGKPFLIPVYIYIYISGPGFPKRQTECRFCILGVSETRSLLIFRKMLISETSSWER